MVWGFNPRGHGGGVDATPWGLSRISQERVGRSGWNLAQLCVHLFYAYSEICSLGSGKVSKELWRHTWRHVRSKSADFAIYRIWVSFIAFWSYYYYYYFTSFTNHSEVGVTVKIKTGHSLQDAHTYIRTHIQVKQAAWHVWGTIQKWPSCYHTTFLVASKI